MPQQGSSIENKRFGSFLRGLREERRLSLDAVEEMSLGLPERVTKSHLSRIENGRAIPTFPRMFTLSQIYGIPVSYLAERFEISLMREMFPEVPVERPVREVLDEAEKLHLSGRDGEALQLYELLLDRIREGRADWDPGLVAHLRLESVNCLLKLARWATAKEECEKLLGAGDLSAEDRVVALEGFAIACTKLGKYTVATMAIDRAQQDLDKLPDSAKASRLRATLTVLRGNACFVTKRFEAAAEAFRQGVEAFEKIDNGFEACRTELNLAAALMEIGSRSRTREILDRALARAEAAGYDRQRAYALGHLAVLAFRENDLDSCEAFCLRSNSVARPREYASLLWRNCYYLWRGRPGETGRVGTEGQRTGAQDLPQPGRGVHAPRSRSSGAISEGERAMSDRPISRVALLLATLAIASPAAAEVGVHQDGPGKLRLTILSLVDDPDPYGKAWNRVHFDDPDWHVLNEEGQANQDGPPSTLIDSDGMPLVVWARNSPQGYDVVLSRFEEEAWTEPELLAGDPTVDELDPRLTLNPADGSVHLVYWVDGGDADGVPPLRSRGSLRLDGAGAGVRRRQPRLPTRRGIPRRCAARRLRGSRPGHRRHAPSDRARHRQRQRLRPSDALDHAPRRPELAPDPQRRKPVVGRLDRLGRRPGRRHDELDPEAPGRRMGCRPERELRRPTRARLPRARDDPDPGGALVLGIPLRRLDRALPLGGGIGLGRRLDPALGRRIRLRCRLRGRCGAGRGRRFR